MTDYTSWHVGMKVVCVDDASPDYPEQVMPLRFGQVYSIASIRAEHNGGVYRGRIRGLLVTLAEVRNPHNPEGVFAIERFRPVQKRKTDISIFTAMLHDKKEHAPA